MSAYDDLVNTIRFWDQIQGDAKRTVICEPHRLDEIRAAVDECGYSSTVTVRASAACPEGRLFVIDEAAMEASDRQALQRMMRDLRR